MMNQPNHNGASNQLARERWGHRAVWLGLMITVAGALSYFLVFARFATLRDYPVLNVALVLLGIIYSLAGCWRVLRRPGWLSGKTLAVVGSTLACGMTGLFYYYLFILSYQLPDTATVPSTQTVAPDWTLSDQNGKSVSLSHYRGSNVVLVFYRGHW
jgi:hypothetical protein